MPTLALDAANNTAGSSIEKMLMHQVASAHGNAISRIAKARIQGQQISIWNNVPRQHIASIEACRLTNAAVRMMNSLQRGVLALERLQNGRRQNLSSGTCPYGVGSSGGGGSRARG